MENKLKVMMATEGTYPFHHGGVSTWSDILVNNLSPNIDYIIYSIMMNPFVTQKFNLPSNSKLIRVPLWGTEEPGEFLEKPFSEIYLSKKRTVDKVIRQDFAPLFIEMIDELISYEKDSKRFGKTLYELYRYFQQYEYKKSFKSEIIWNAYKSHIFNHYRDKQKNMEHPGVYSLIQSLGWVYRFMTILSVPVPKVHVTHSAAAAFCGVPCVLAKFQDNTPFLLTEHGVYLREQYLSLSQRGYTPFLNTFLIRMIHSIVDLSYFYADQVSPVCSYNTRWEKKLGVEEKKIEVIYNGVDTEIFSPSSDANQNKYPTVVSVARIDPIKDIVGLIRAASIVKKEIPDVRFIVYGSITVPEYFEECLKAKEEYKLGESFVFAGHTDDVPASYRSGDIIALSSISEGFPYSVVEAMMSGKPVVSTEVGGIKEAIGNTGFLVPPRSAEKMAEAIIKLIKNKNLRKSLGDQARERALKHFDIRQIQDLYLKSYMRLVMEANNSKVLEKAETKAVRNRARFHVEKGYALLKNGYFTEAISQLYMAIREEPESPAVPVLLTQIAEAYNCLGQYERALIELQRAEILNKILLMNKIA